MPVTLADNNYGKSQVRLVKVIRQGDRHDLKDLTVDLQLRGDFEAAHTAGDNSRVLPTDTMKNTVYALAARHPIDQIEEFGKVLAARLLNKNPQVSQAGVSIREHVWTRIIAGGVPHRHAFAAAGGEKRTALVTAAGDRVTVESGIEDLVVLKTTRSAFTGFVHDEFTTLPETHDRIFCTSIRASWVYAHPDVAFGLCWRGVRQVLLDTFADHDSQSVQHTLYAMGEAVLEVHEDVVEIRLSLPNRHHLLVNLSPFGIANPNEIFVPTEEPYGLIEAVLRK